MIQIILKPEKDKLARKGHAWVFSGAIARQSGQPAPGALVQVCASDGRFVAWGHYNPGSQIRVRLLDWDPQAVIDRSWYHRRLHEALALRRRWKAQSSVQRLVFSEGDGLPGLVADLYNHTLVLQLLTAGQEALRELWVELFVEALPGLTGIYERSEGEGRESEGLPPRRGCLWGVHPGGLIEVQDGPLQFLVDLDGQKTGFYSDQSLNRRRVAAYAPGAEVLDAFCYTGGFGAWALASGARDLTLLDSSREALDLALKNLALNSLGPVSTLGTDAFQGLRDLKAQGRRFGLVVLDPPKLAFSRPQVPKALRAYKDLLLQGLALTAPGGVLAAFSCSGLVSRPDFEQAVAWAVQDAGRRVRILETLSQAPDHPVRPEHPDSAYLKGLILEVT